MTDDTFLALENRLARLDELMDDKQDEINEAADNLARLEREYDNLATMWAATFRRLYSLEEAANDNI